MHVSELAELERMLRRGERVYTESYAAAVYFMKRGYSVVYDAVRGLYVAEP
jgi:predicted kinase